ncbi:hypothetical protein EKK58_01230 [Candidatus Dependentiae bacterium]|nr:MAG: hypothetical protein EKK58_01230 [Candidatus Dependentiae bacterium]
MSFLSDTKEYALDYLFIKFANLKHPTLIPWIEVGAGIYVHEESTVDQLVFLTRKSSNSKEDDDDETVTENTADDTPTKTHLKKEDLIRYLDSKLREPTNPHIIDYGPVEDLRMQPAGRDMTREVFAFLAKYGAV